MKKKKFLLTLNEFKKTKTITNNIILNRKSLPKKDKDSISELNRIYPYLISEINVSHKITIFNDVKLI